MSGENGWGWGMTPVGVPVPLPSVMVQREEERWRHFDNSINAVSFGFVATAILISMFLVMAIFERFLRPRSTDGSTGGQRNNAAAAAADLLESGMAVPAPAKFAVQSPNMSIYAKGVSVLMPGEEIPTFIGHPAPVPPPPPIPWHAPVLVHLGGSQGLIVSPATTHSTFRSASASTTP